MINKVSIVSTQSLITLSVPTQQLWKFLFAFGYEFGILTVSDGGEYKAVREVESYTEDSRTLGETMLVVVRLQPEEMEKLSAFCASFSEGIATGSVSAQGKQQRKEVVRIVLPPCPSGSAVAKDDDVQAHDLHLASLPTPSVATKLEEMPVCPSCGLETVRNGACYKCLNCGESLGCS